MNRRQMASRIASGALLIASSAVVLTACAMAVATRQVELGSVETPGVVIRAQSGAFTLRSGEHFRPVGVSSCYAPNAPRMPVDNLVNEAAAGMRLGAHPVTVEVEGRAHPLNGLLLFCDVPSVAVGPASRSYRLVVPPRYVESAAGGRISAVYERVDFTNREGVAEWHYAWVLWLSDEPIR